MFFEIWKSNLDNKELYNFVDCLDNSIDISSVCYMFRVYYKIRTGIRADSSVLSTWPAPDAANKASR